jgi:hypothetical protein
MRLVAASDAAVVDVDEAELGQRLQRPGEVGGSKQRDGVNDPPVEDDRDPVPPSSSKYTPVPSSAFLAYGMTASSLDVGEHLSYRAVIVNTPRFWGAHHCPSGANLTERARSLAPLAPAPIRL